MVDDFIGRKHGLRKVEYEFEELAPVVHPILEDTYGVILYQEQVMKIASDLAKYSLGEGDNLRRAMGKKDPAELTEERKKELGFNDSALHWDLVNTEPKKVTAFLRDGTKTVIYGDGMFAMPARN